MDNILEELTALNAKMDMLLLLRDSLEGMSSLDDVKRWIYDRQSEIEDRVEFGAARSRVAERTAGVGQGGIKAPPSFPPSPSVRESKLRRWLWRRQWYRMLLFRWWKFQGKL